MLNNKHHFTCECGKPSLSMAEDEYHRYIAEYGHDCPPQCDECATITLEMAGWLPEDFAEHTPDLAKYAQKKLASRIFRFKRFYRKFTKREQSIRQAISQSKRKIKINEHNPFFKHKKESLIRDIERQSEQLSTYKSHLKEIQDVLFMLIEMFDKYGKATPHEYAAILSTSHIHIEKALQNEDVNGLMALISYHVEDGANTGEFTQNDCVLHDATTEFIIRQIMSNDELRESTNKIAMDMFVEAMGRPLPMYTITTLPNGERVARQIPPKLKSVK